ncbi:MAG TPA: plastocyanin/azurin family copper-binding protein [Solirubrobacteraceae bacterium]|nr:plastocyanin/azurin family copper-binding protein [Solirubrobacteraceae bacterium]
MPRTSILALVGVAFAVAGCGSSSNTSSSSSTNSAASVNAPAESTPSSGPFLAKFTNVSKVASTVPANGDINPYGIVIVPTSVGKLQAGQMLISNFNAKESAKENGQGTGTTIVQVSRNGKLSTFATIDAKTLPGPCPGGVGLTTALNTLPGGYVVVGSLPTTNGKTATAKYGCMIVLDSSGKPVSTISGPNIQGPWDSTAVSEGSKTNLFVSNALNGGAAKGVHTIDNSNVVRIVLESGEGQPPKVVSETVIANGIPWVNSAEALVLGPTGLALASNGTLYVASTDGNKIFAISEAMTRTTPAAKGGTVLTEGGHLKEPLGLVLAPNGNIITSNGGDGNMVETTPAGQQIAVQTADKKTGAGSLFGFVIAPQGKGIYFVDDGENTLNLLNEGKPASTGASTASTRTSTKAAASSGASSAPENLSLEANAEGQLKYNTTSLSAKAGKVSIDFTNMAPEGHNVTVESAAGEKVGATPTFQGGSKTLSLNLKPGTYKFFCSVPGHRMAGMEGTLTVK